MKKKKLEKSFPNIGQCEKLTWAGPYEKPIDGSMAPCVDTALLGAISQEYVFI
jgi:hypothetical protein